jgi:transposase
MDKIFIGVDVSNVTLDAAIHGHKDQIRVSNDQSGADKLLAWIQSHGIDLSNCVVCFEHTGVYSVFLSQHLTKKGVTFYLVSGLRVKRSLGLVRGKSDQIDAKNLARFAFLFNQELSPYVMPDELIQKLKALISCRAKFVRQNTAQKTSLRGYKKLFDCQDPIILATQKTIEFLQQQIKDIEKQMITLISSDPQIKQTYENVTSIHGVGMVLASSMIAATNNFQSFKSWRSFACYAGIAPFEHSSGTSYKGKTRISHLGSRPLKCLLSQSAATSIKNNPEMRIYFERRTREGKSKMSTLNIVRNKIVSRIFAVANRNSPYVELHKYVA